MIVVLAAISLAPIGRPSASETLVATTWRHSKAWCASAGYLTPARILSPNGATDLGRPVEPFGQEPPPPLDPSRDATTMLLLMNGAQPVTNTIQGSFGVSHALGQTVAVTDITEKMLLDKNFSEWASQFGGMNDKLKTVVVIVPRVPAPGKIDAYIPTLRREVEIFRKIRRLSALYVCVPTGHDVFAREFLVPLTRQAARETHASTIELGDYPSMPLALRDVLLDARVDKHGWKLLSADSEQPDEGPAANAIDGNPATYWHTRYDPTVAKYPHELVVDMGQTIPIDGFGYTPRQDGGVNGRVKAYAFYVSADGSDWGPPVASGNLPNSPKVTRVHFSKPVTGRYWRFVAKSEQNGGPWATAAEIDVLRAAPASEPYSPQP